MKLKEAINKFEYLSEETREKDCSLFPAKGSPQFQVYKPNTASEDLMHYIFPENNQEICEKNINIAKKAMEGKVRFSVPIINNDTDFRSNNGTMDVFDAMAIAIMYRYLSQKIKTSSGLGNKTLEDIIKDKITNYSSISDNVKTEKQSANTIYSDAYNKINKIGETIEQKNKPSSPPAGSGSGSGNSSPKVSKNSQNSQASQSTSQSASKSNTSKTSTSSSKTTPKTNTEKLDEINNNFKTTMAEYHKKNIDEKKAAVDDTIKKLMDLQKDANAIDADDDAFQKKINDFCSLVKKSVDEIEDETKDDAGSKLDAAVQAAAKNLQKNNQNNSANKSNSKPSKKQTINKTVSQNPNTGKIDFASFGYGDDED